ncbi:MAG: radical SAM protein [archaeon]
MSAKKILLINPPATLSKGINESTMYPPIGLGYLSSYLKKYATINQYHVRIIDANALGLGLEAVLKEASAFRPDVVGIHMNVILAASGIQIAKAIKAAHDAMVCIGGPLTSSNPEEMLALSGADIAFVGESEQTFLEICEGRQPDKVAGVAYLKKGKFFRTEPRKLIEDLDAIPFPDYDIMPPLRKYESRARRFPVGVIMSSRGCPYQCTFCNSSIFGKRYRARSPENVVDEIEMLVRKYGIGQLDVLDDNFTLDIERAGRILDLIIERKLDILINLQNGVRADRLTWDIVMKMKRAGVFKAGVGIESADGDVLKSIRKSLDPDKVIRALAWFRKAGIITVGFFILGFPNDSRESIERTIRFAIKSNPSIANFCMLTPFPGTEMYESMKKSGLLKDESALVYQSGFYDANLYHRCPKLTEEELRAFQRKAYLGFFFRPRKMVEMLLTIRSYRELKWTLGTISPIAQSILKFIKIRRRPLH